ncbi:MAG TPA: hypothetical protein VNI01_13345 [Elusimicrobiota bacterium]|jgi:hypothetical protein|nr:hypothetical protein [Elusimicrobiota bacterium]
MKRLKTRGETSADANAALSAPVAAPARMVWCHQPKFGERVRAERRVWTLRRAA